MKETTLKEGRTTTPLARLIGGRGPRGHVLMMSLVIVCIIAWFAAPVYAEYSYDGFSLTDATHGTIKGKVFIDKGSKYGLQSPWYNTTFSVPSGDSVEWAKIYVSVWGGTQYYEGWVNGTINNGNTYTLTPTYLDMDSSSTTYRGAGNGKWVVPHDVTQYLNPGQTFMANITTSGAIDGRVYDVTLVAVINDDTANKTAYWINYGLVNEHYAAPGIEYELNNNITTFAAPSYSSSEAKVYAVQLVGTSGENDFAYFTVPDGDDSPRDLDNIDWDLEAYWKYQLGTDDDLADSSQGSYFDLDEFTTSNDSTALKDLVNLRGDNDIVFWRGHDYDDSETIEGKWNASNYEGETYVSPMIAALVLKDITRVYDFSSTTLGDAGSSLKAYEGEGTSFDNTTPESDISTSLELTADDGSYKEYETEEEGDYAAQRFVFTLQNPDTTTANIAKLIATWNGIGTGPSNGTTLYIWNAAGSSYTQLATNDVSSDSTLSGYVESPNIANYISSNTVTVLVVQNGADNGTPSTIETDYVKLVVDPEV